MQRSEWDFENRIDDDEPDVALPGSPQVFADRFGVRTALCYILQRATFLKTRPARDPYSRDKKRYA